MICKNCQRRIRKDTPICPYCSTPQTGSVSLGAVSGEGADKRVPLSKGRKQVLIIACVLAALLIAGAAALFLAGGSLSAYTLDKLERVGWVAAVALIAVGMVLFLFGLLMARKMWKRILLVVIAVLFVLPGCGSIYGLLNWRNWVVDYLDENVTQGPQLNQEDLGINPELPDEDVINIALFGLDNRSDVGNGRSDAIIILSVDRVHNKVKMASIARDTLANVDGWGKSNIDETSYDSLVNARRNDWTKITHAFYYGAHLKGAKRNGPGVAIKALNENFGLNISRYAYVNFHEFVDLVDLVGGVELNILQRELTQLNKQIRSLARFEKFNVKELSEAGLQTLSGAQALSYARLRKVDSDIMRGNRQKAVIEAVMKKAMKMSPLEYPNLIKQAMNICNTNMTGGEILGVAEWMFDNNPTVENFSLPDDKCRIYSWDSYGHKSSDAFKSFGSTYILDLDYAAAYLRDFIYETNEAESLDPKRMTWPELPQHLKDLLKKKAEQAASGG